MWGAEECGGVPRKRNIHSFQIYEYKEMTEINKE